MERPDPDDRAKGREAADEEDEEARQGSALDKRVARYERKRGYAHESREARIPVHEDGCQRDVALIRILVQVIPLDQVAADHGGKEVIKEHAYEIDGEELGIGDINVLLEDDRPPEGGNGLGAEKQYRHEDDRERVYRGKGLPERRKVYRAQEEIHYRYAYAALDERGDYTLHLPSTFLTVYMGLPCDSW